MNVKIAGLFRMPVRMRRLSSKPYSLCLSLMLLLIVCGAVRAQQEDPDTLAIPGALLTRNIRYADASPRQNFDLYRPESARLGVLAEGKTGDLEMTGGRGKTGGGRMDTGRQRTGDRGKTAGMVVGGQRCGQQAMLPLIIWIHGGGWWTGGKKSMEIPYLISHGYAIASIGYRFSQDSVFPTQIRDCYAAVRYIFRHARELGVDTSQVVVAGASAGGHLSSLLAMSLNNHRRDFDAETGKGQRISIKGVLDFYGPCDLYAFHGDGAAYKVDSSYSSTSRLLGAPAMLRPDLAKWASPTTYVDKGDPPVLLLHGDKDPIVHYYLAPLFYNILLEAGVRARLVTIPGAGHGGAEFSDSRRQENVLAFLQQVLKK